MTGRPYDRVARGKKTSRKANPVERRGRLTIRLWGRDDCQTAWKPDPLSAPGSDSISV